MALYELEDGRLVPAQFGREVPGGFSDDVLDAVRSQVLEIVSRPLFPIAWQSGGMFSNDLPRLTALDAAGQVVAVEVVKELDADVLIEALSRLADSAAMSWTDLARQYPDGIEGFKTGWAKFRESMPTSPPNGPRMILVAAHIAAEVRPALDVLSSSGVEVHEMSLRQTSNGRSFLEVEPVGHRLYNHRFTPVVESSSPLPALAASARRSHRRQAKETGTPDVLARRSKPEEEAARQPEPSTYKPSITKTTSDPNKSEVTGSGVKRPESERPAPKIPTPKRPAKSTIPRPSGLPTRASRRAMRRAADQPVLEPGTLPKRRSRRPQPEPVRQRKVEMDASGLRAIAQMLGADVPLSLLPPSRTPNGALLSLEGQVLVPAGVFADPSQALRASGIYGESGWDAWHIGDEQGPTLREAIEEVNANR